MTRIAGLFLLLLLSACAGNNRAGPPSNLNNACSMKVERPGWFKSMARTEAKWGAPVYVQMATFYQESTFRPKARTPRKYILGIIPNGRVSSAYGYAQAIDGTWGDYKKSTGRWNARRDRFSDASDFMGWYMSQSNRRNFIPFSDAYNQYLAYHEGQTGFARGSYNSKAWLLNTAQKVSSRAATYRDQLQNCPI
ncbi:MAG: lytic transglycosylase [Pseudomonadota bacterium]